MFPLNIFLNQHETNHFTDDDIKKLTIPSGVDKFKYEIQANIHYHEILKTAVLVFNKNVFSSKNNGRYCFYCGSPAEITIPAFLHNGSGINLWMFTDWRCTTILCKDCDRHAGKNNVTYKKKFTKISPNNSKKLLTFEPDIVLPSLEPAFKHFEYSKDGLLKAITVRGKTTIHRFALNREDLVQRRIKAISEYKEDIGFTHSDINAVDALFCLAQETDFSLDNNELFENLAKYLHRKSHLYADTDEIYHLLPIKYRTITYQNLHEVRM